MKCTECGSEKTAITVPKINHMGMMKARWACANCHVSFLAPVVKHATPDVQPNDYALPDGVPCPECGSRPWKVRSTRTEDGYRTRKHKCRECGYLGKTVEAV